MTERWEMSLHGDEIEVHRVSAWLEQAAAAHALDMAAVQELELALEEVLVNIMWHAGEEAKAQPIVIRAELENGVMAVAIRDHGRAFNPLLAAEPDLTAPLEERRIGGLGVHLVKHLTDSQRYCREDDTNVLTLTKRLAQRGET